MKTISVYTILLSALLTACTNTPTIISFNDQSIGTYNPTAGCSKLLLQQDCSRAVGATRNITIDEIELRIAGSINGRALLIMSKPRLARPDSVALKNGKIAVDNFFARRDIAIIETKPIYGNNVIIGFHYTLDVDGYSQLKALSTKK